MITIIGGDFTRSWLSLPLSHGIKVKGGKKIQFWGVPYFQTNPVLDSETGRWWMAPSQEHNQGDATICVQGES